MDILLHICCGPCLIYPFKRLKEQGFNFKGFFYNPNLYPPQEYLRRKEGVEFLSAGFGLSVDYPEFENEEFLRQAAPLSGSLRCLKCWSLRLNKCAAAAKQLGFKAFSTTLLVSPYQDHALLRQAARQAALDHQIDFYYEDFRPGFKWAQAEAKDKGVYRQKYCGCKYSLENSGHAKKFTGIEK